jgi:pullulanase/glycogen debranching enzyme
MIGDIFAIFNANKEAITINLPEGKWNIYINDKKAGNQVLDNVQNNATIPEISAMILKNV